MGEQLKDGLGQAWNLVATFVPKLVGFLIILLIGWLIAKAVSKALSLVLGKLGFSRLVEKTGLTGMMKQANVDATGILVKLVYYFILLIALQLAFGVFGPSNPVSRLLNDIIAFLPRILVALVLVVVAAAIAKVVRDVVSSAMATRPAGRLLATVAYWLIMAFGIIAALGQVDIATAVTGPVLITVLATIGGVIVVGFGGGLIKPAQDRWGGWLTNLQGQLGTQGGGQRQVGGRTTQAQTTQAQTTQAQTTQAQTTQAQAQTTQATRTAPAAQPGNGHQTATDTPTPPVGFNRVDH
ncbi:mechanosensitive ion channel family protein [Amycolatopsis sp. NPDC004368]